MIRRIVAASPGRRVLDVGCGPGTAARQFRPAGCEVLGLEPDARMAAFARRAGLDVDVATFEDWDPAGRVFDAVTAASAWHWVDPVAGAAKAGQLLPPGGLLAVFWYPFHLPPDLADAFYAIYLWLVPDVAALLPGRQPPGFLRPVYKRAADGIQEAGGFSEPEQWQWDWELTCTRDMWLDQIPAFPALSGIAPGALEELVDRAGAAIDAAGGSFPVRYASVTITAVRAASLPGQTRPAPSPEPVCSAINNPEAQRSEETGLARTLKLASPARYRLAAGDLVAPRVEQSGYTRRSFRLAGGPGQAHAAFLAGAPGMKEALVGLPPDYSFNHAGVITQRSGHTWLLSRQ